MQVHFGMSGSFKALSLPGREATPTTRLTLVNHELKLVAHLSAMTVAHGDLGVPRRARKTLKRQIMIMKGLIGRTFPRQKVQRTPSAEIEPATACDVDILRLLSARDLRYHVFC